jgi:hypothetical protein
VAAEPAPEPGEASPALAQAVALARRLPELGLPAPEEVGVAADDDPAGFWLRLPGLRAQFVLGREDVDAKLADLAHLLREARSELANAERVDLRFRDQAVLDVPPPPTEAAKAAAPRGNAGPSNKRRPGEPAAG